ncbi:hypothetical protein D9758_013835 [Tetrapyrgos nigripes]|uniref:Uncharacterized protein n=1 Tax=Tetrapyrgos nigripes TaxID=182062 RepID=A0A8H5CTM2_9AGAR|nr:hypothetical protein D9758_013835 [Tetrapyrgos nigripes]
MSLTNGRGSNPAPSTSKMMSIKKSRTQPNDVDDLLQKVNALLVFLHLPITLESLFELTPSLLLAILECLLGTRLPIEDGVRLLLSSPKRGSSAKRNSDKATLAKIHAMKLFLGTLETDLVQADVGLSRVDPEKLAEGGWDEVVAVARVLGRLFKDLSSQTSSRPGTTTIVTTQHQDWRAEDRRMRSLDLLSFGNTSHSLSPLGTFVSASVSPQSQSEEVNHAQVPASSSSSSSSKFHPTSHRQLQSHPDTKDKRPKRQPKTQALSRCIHELPSPSPEDSATCDCSNPHSTESYLPEHAHSHSDFPNPPSAFQTLSPTKSPFTPRLAMLTQTWIKKVDLEEEIRRFREHEQHSRSHSRSPPAQPSGSGGSMVHPEDVSGDTTITSSAISAGTIDGVEEEEEGHRRSRSMLRGVRNPILPPSLSSSKRAVHTAMGGVFMDYDSGEDDNFIDVEEDPLYDDDEDPHRQTILLLQERARLLQELALARVSVFGG